MGGSNRLENVSRKNSFHFILIVLLSSFAISGIKSQRVCANLFNNRTLISINKDYPLSVQEREGEESVEQCKNANSCYTLWKETVNSDNITVTTVLAQGCWESSNKEECGLEVCTAIHKQTKALNNTKFCCCTEDLCNRNHTELPYSADYKDLKDAISVSISHSGGLNFSRREMTVVLAACTLTLIAMVLALMAMSRRWRDQTKGVLSDTVLLIEYGHQGNSNIIDHIKLSSIVGQGRYGTIWLGLVDNQQVAVKVFPATCKQYYYNERDIYCLSYMNNPALLKYFGYSEKARCDNNFMEYMLVFSYCSNGCLQDYIKLHTVDFNTFCQMALSIAKGLAFLHTDLTIGATTKPCICHRDLNTRNILVKDDLTCCLCDLGLAIKLNGSHYYTLDGEQHAETKSISDVGTLRYMAPEVLEGAVNLRDCESSLKQIDVYALGLVLWELATRCSDFCQPNSEPPAYKMPFEAEIGQHTTFEQMQVLVTRNKARPLFPEVWTDCAATRLVLETINDCWDQDAEARLTVLCVEERLKELSAMNFKGMGQIGVSPTINATQTLLSLPSYNYYNNNNRANESTEDTDKDGMDSNISEGTVETLLTLSPSEPCMETIANSKNFNSRTNPIPAIQPYQGRNPCFERNLMWDDKCQGDLIDKSMKHHPPQSQSFFSETNSLVSNDFSLPRQNAPIPYVQNNVQTMPKQPNVPGNNVSHKQYSGILSKPFKKLLDTKKCKSDSSSCSKSNIRSLRDTEVSIGDQRAITAILNGKENTSSTSDLANNTKTKDNNINVKVIISPFEESFNGVLKQKSVERPSSLPLINSKLLNPEKKTNLDDMTNLDDIFTDGSKGKLKDLAGRIKTPGDVPPSVRRKRGKSVLGETRFSLYDDRMMEGLKVDDTLVEEKVTQSFPSGIELSGRQGKLDSSF